MVQLRYCGHSAITDYGHIDQSQMKELTQNDPWIKVNPQCLPWGYASFTPCHNHGVGGEHHRTATINTFFCKTTRAQLTMYCHRPWDNPKLQSHYGFNCNNQGWTPLFWLPWFRAVTIYRYIGILQYSFQRYVPRYKRHVTVFCDIFQFRYIFGYLGWSQSQGYVL